MALAEHAPVADVAVIGVPDPKWVEAVQAVVVLKAGAAGDSSRADRSLQDLIARYKCPKSVDVRTRAAALAVRQDQQSRIRDRYRSSRPEACRKLFSSSIPGKHTPSTHLSDRASCKSHRTAQCRASWPIAEAIVPARPAMSTSIRRGRNGSGRHARRAGHDRMRSCIRQENSRLSCQIPVTPELDGLVVRLPKAQVSTLRSSATATCKPKRPAACCRGRSTSIC